MEPLAPQPPGEFSSLSQSISGSEKIRLVQGLSAIFWSLPIALYLGVSGLFARSSDLLPYHAWLFAIALGTLSFGVFRFVSVKTPGKHWLQQVRRTAVAAVLCLYFSFFIRWWRLQPENLHLLANVFALSLTSIALLAFLASALAELAIWFGETSLAGDFRVTFFMSLLLGLIPVVGGLGGLLATVTFPSDSKVFIGLVNLGERISFLLQAEHRWTTFALACAALFPVSVLLLSIWKLKARMLRILSGEKSSIGEPVARRRRVR